MNQLISSKAITMSSRDIADLTGKRHDHVMADISKMIEWLGDTCPDFSGDLPDSYGRPQKVYFLPKRETLILVSGYNIDLRAKIIDRWQELESANAQPKIPTHNEAFLQLFQSAVEQDRVIKEQGERLIAVENKLEKAIEANVWDHCPQNCEPITKIRQRINERYGISAKIVDQVMRDMPFSPRIAGMVRNGNKNAQGAHYAVYHTKDVSNVFKMFVSECEQVTKEFFKHRLISKSFKLISR